MEINGVKQSENKKVSTSKKNIDRKWKAICKLNRNSSEPNNVLSKAVQLNNAQ
jgi:hypothetical protein